MDYETCITGYEVKWTTRVFVASETGARVNLKSVVKCAFQTSVRNVTSLKNATSNILLLEGGGKRTFRQLGGGFGSSV